ncbi:MAG TPA: glycosyltransferase [Steroidobacteraceae bacterium]|nr:glycosyltransferase [Steroidobacteraceae bacterium]
MLALLALTVWLYLYFAHGRFWVSAPELPAAVPPQCPPVDIIVPARDEAATIAPVIASLLAQDYAGAFHVLLVDDDSTDDTAVRAGTAANLRILRGQPKPAGWSGKLWALHQGVAASSAPWLLFTDADIVHDPRHLGALMAGAQQYGLSLLSEMVRLNCSSLAERALVPAFVYFFQMLYPFARVNDPHSGVAAAAGGTILIRRAILERSGGIEAIRGALIDDVALAVLVKPVAPIFLGHSAFAASIRPYPHFADLWQMIARTAFTQLRYSVLLLAGTIAALTLVWLVPVACMVGGRGLGRGCGVLAFTLAALSYQPTLRRYRRSPLWALGLPLIALFYMAATIDSARSYWFGRGSRWKSRAYERAPDQRR